MYLQLAEGTSEQNPYVFVPDPSGNTSGIYMREDYLDHLTDLEWKTLMKQIAPFQPQVQNGSMSEPYFLSDRASRKAHREERKKAKEEKKQLKNEKKDAKNKLIEARAGAKASGKGGNVLGTIMDGVKNILGKGDTTDTSTLPETTPDTDTEDTKEKPWYTNPLVIGAGVLLLAGGIYVATKPKGK